MSPTTKTIKILRALKLGIEIEKDGYTYIMQDNRVGIKALKICGITNEESFVFLGIDWDINVWIQFCGEFSKDEIFTITSQIVLLSEVKKSVRKN